MATERVASHAMYFGSTPKTSQIWQGSVCGTMLASHTCCGHRKSIPVWVSGTNWSTSTMRVSLKRYSLRGGVPSMATVSPLTLIVEFSSNHPPDLIPSLEDHPCLRQQRKVTFRKSDVQSSSTLGRHFQFPKTFYVTHSSTSKDNRTDPPPPLQDESHDLITQCINFLLILKNCNNILQKVSICS